MQAKNRAERRVSAEAKILEAINRYESCHNGLCPRAGAIAHLARMKVPTVYYHLQSMRRMHLVEERGEGRYGIADVLSDY